MRAALIENYGGADQVKLKDVKTPAVEPNEVQIEVAYAAINPADWKIREGLFKSRQPYEFPIVIGWDVAGKVSQVGSEVKNFKVGDLVFTCAKKPTIQWGTLAEFVNVEAQNVVLAPKKITLQEAASIPLVSLTAWQSIVEKGKIKAGDVVLIHAGAGSVGSIAIQIAKHFGAIVITTASAAHHPLVKKLGADIVIDYKSDNFVEKIKELYPRGIDLVFDTVGGDTSETSLKVLKRGGKFVSLLSQIDDTTSSKYEITASYVYIRPDGAQLKEIASLIDAGKIVPSTITEFPFEQAGDAIELVKQGKIKGKAVVTIRKGN